jgi:hypothetical protein
MSRIRKHLYAVGHLNSIDTYWDRNFMEYILFTSFCRIIFRIASLSHQWSMFRFPKVLTFFFFTQLSCICASLSFCPPTPIFWFSYEYPNNRLELVIEFHGNCMNSMPLEVTRFWSLFNFLLTTIYSCVVAWQCRICHQPPLALVSVVVNTPLEVSETTK